MKKTVIYTNKDNEDFEVTSENILGLLSRQLTIRITSGNNALYLLDKEEVVDFCKILMDEAEKAFPDK